MVYLFLHKRCIVVVEQHKMFVLEKYKRISNLIGVE